MYLTIVGYSNVVSRLPEVFAAKDVTIRVIGLSSNPLRNSKFVDEFIILKNPQIGASIGKTLLASPAALEKIEGLVCYQDDETPWEIANSSLPLETKTESFLQRI